MSIFNVMFIIFHTGSYEKYEDFGWLGIRYIISELKKETSIDIQVKEVGHDNIHDILNSVILAKPNIIAFPLLQQHLKIAKLFSDIIKQTIPDTIIVCGNTEATLRTETILDHIKSIDIAVIGEGEYTFRQLAVLIKDKKPLHNCKGICFRKDNSLIYTAQRNLEHNLDRFSFPDRTIFPTRRKIFDIITSRGCQGKCTFCASRVFQMQDQPRHRCRSLNNVINEIQHLIRYHNASYISISDDTFADQVTDRDFGLREFNEELIKRKINIRYRIQLRCENINPETAPVLKEMQKNGLDNIFVGFESGNTEDLKLYNKKAGKKECDTALELLNEYELPYSMGFIMFNPYTTRQRLSENLDFIQKGKNIVTPYLLCSRLKLYNGATIVKKVIKDNLVISDLCDELIEEHQYRFLYSEVESIWNAFYRMNSLNIDFIELDMIDSSFKNFIYSEHPITKSDLFKELHNSFYQCVTHIKASLLSYSRKILETMDEALLTESEGEDFYVLKDSIISHLKTIKKIRDQVVKV